MSSKTRGGETETVAAQAAPPIVFVDLDGTLVSSDLLWESLFLAIKARPTTVFAVLGALRQGPAAVKRVLASRVQPDPRRLPYNPQVLAHLNALRAQGVRLVLATASDREWAQAVAKHLGIFADVLASDGTKNLKGAGKLAAIQEYCAQAGLSEFTYMGDSRADLPIWERAATAVVVAPSAGLRKALADRSIQAQEVSHRPSRLRPLVKALRPHQWVKNLLIFVPVLLGHRVGDLPTVLHACLAFCSFSACASFVYVLNDLFDIEADRQHARKRRRPFASGTLPVAWGLPLAGTLLAVGFTLAAITLPPEFCGLLGLYLVVTTLYTWVLKTKVLVDVLVLAGLYTLRIIAGGFATQIVISEWLLAFSIFIFTSLAFAKRFVELSGHAEDPQAPLAGRGYRPSDLALIQSIGPTSGYLAVLVFALYVHSDEVRLLYHNTLPLWLICPLILYWISWLWCVAGRRQLHDDPVVFAMTDRVSQFTIALVLGLAVLATVTR